MRSRPAVRVLRALAALGVVWGTAAWGPSAHAAPTITFTDCPAPASPSPGPSPSPTPECVPESGTVVKGPVVLKFHVSAGTQAGLERRIKEVNVFVFEDGSPDPGGSMYQRLFPACGSQARNQETITLEWDTRTLLNGAYTVRVEATNHSEQGTCVHATDTETASMEQRSDLRVDNPPAKPAAPQVVVATPEGVSVKWTAAPEGDVQSYTLYRAVTSGSEQAPTDDDFEAVEITTKTETFDDVSSPGAYWYKVRVTRRSVVTPDEGISSELSSRSGAGVVTPPTPAPVPPGPTAEPTPRPRLTPKPLPKKVNKPPPVPDAPFSAFLPFDVPEEGEPDEVPLARPEAEPDAAEDPRGPVLPVAVGVFLVSSALALGRMPV